MSMHLAEATITPGTISGDVRTIQTILTGQGYNVGPIDGNFGPQTISAVQSFQKAKGLVPDGIVGPQTWAALQGKTFEPIAPLQPAPLPEPVKTGNNTLLMIGLLLTGAAFLMVRR